MALLFTPGKQFYVDWTNTVWLVGYVGEYFAKHASFPTVISTNQVIGMPLPVFYGYLFLPIAGVLSALVGADISIRSICVIVTFGQTMAILVVSRKVGLKKWYGYALAAIFAWRPYPLTNLYNRGDVTEFVAFTLVTIGVVSCFVCAPRNEWRISCTIPSLFLVLAVGTNPSAGLIGMLAFALVALTMFAVVGDRRQFALAACANIVLIVCVLAPWLYAVAKYQSSLSLITYPVLQYYAEIDNLANRIVPFPFDVRTLISGFNVSTPYLDAQISIPLAIIALGCLLFIDRNKSRKVQWIWAVSLLCAFAILLISGVPVLGRAIPGIQVIQFAYRLINICDIALLFAAGAALLTSNGLLATHGQPKIPPFLVVACVAAALLSAGVKLTHGAAVETSDVGQGTDFMGSRAVLVNLPSSFYGWYDYVSMHGSAGPVAPGPHHVVPMKVLGLGKRFGRIDILTAPVTGTVTTNVEAFPWNHIVVDGKARLTRETRTDGYMIALTVRKGAQLAFAVIPAPTWSYLRMISGLTFLAWIAALCVAWVIDHVRPIFRGRVRGQEVDA